MTGCSVSKFRDQNSTVINDIDLKSIEVNDIKRQNLTSVAFFIQKAEIEIISREEKQKFLGTIKYNIPDSFLISLRSATGIEAARILITSDTILINDRVSKTLFFGAQVDGRKKYGFSNILLPVLFGDVIINQKKEPMISECENGISDLESFVDGCKVNYSIDCKKNKSISLAITRDIDNKPVYIKYDDFGSFAGISFAKRVRINGLNNFEIISIKFSKIEVPWKGNLEFIPGNNYEQIEIK